MKSPSRKRKKTNNIDSKMNNRKDKWTYILEKQELRTKKTDIFLM